MNTTAPTTVVHEGISLFSGIVMGAVFSLANSLFYSIPWTMAFILFRRYGIRLYTLTKRDECQRVQRRVKKHSSHTHDGEKGYGYAFGKWYFLNISIEEGEYSVWMIATHSSYQQLVEDLTEDGDMDDSVTEVVEEGNEEDDEERSTLPPNSIAMYDLRGRYDAIWFQMRLLKHFYHTPRPSQVPILESIKQIYNTKKRAVVLIYGPPNSGKSLVGLLLAKHYRSSYTNEFEPWKPGIKLAALLDEAEPKRNHPLIISMDEIDVPLTKIHNSEIVPHKHLSIDVMDKSGWNRLFDNFERGLFPNTIILLTTNKTPSIINALDPSYIREGRVDLVVEMRPKTD